MQTKPYVTKLIKILFCKFSHVEKFSRQWNVNYIYGNKNPGITNGCRKWRNRFKREKIVFLAEYLEQQTDYPRYSRKIRKSRKDPSWKKNQPYLFTFPYQINGKHAMELSTVSHVILEWHWKNCLKLLAKIFWLGCLNVFKGGKIWTHLYCTLTKLIFVVIYFCERLGFLWIYFRRCKFRHISRAFIS